MGSGTAPGRLLRGGAGRGRRGGRSGPSRRARSMEAAAEAPGGPAVLSCFSYNQDCT